ncbi:PREDICTED: Down syndrome cell adhesion molecule-like protein Dscam2 [Priapulus caudatus]|uniref:Down syndrome cell adhesion molecule-like protein Dscam2 n=1 Tax=Priapulus caudatus TaxID=37621 RepID=A0ABM1EKJ8_PRICU|nr:PREDICTED: Down syndrome cell adhesion molecule-like protein Dscam2 [Priapulus caudatus]
MEYMYARGEGEVFQESLRWLGSSCETLTIAGALAVGNFARNEVTLQDSDVIRGPVFETQPPSTVIFTNDTGVLLRCSAAGTSGDKFSIFATGELHIRNVSIADVTYAYKCSTKHIITGEQTDSVRSGRLRLREALKVTTEPTLQTVDVGRSAAFTCLVAGYPVNEVTWYKDGERLRSSDSVVMEMDRVVRITSVAREDGGMYQCVASNERETAEATAELKLGAAPPAITSGFGELTIYRGSAVSLQCQASGNPPPQMLWTLDDLPITGSDRVTITTYRLDNGDVVSYLNRSNVRVEDGGAFQCTARNQHGAAEHMGRVNVFGPPFIRPMPDITAVANKNLTIKCHVSGHPIESVTWEKGGARLPTITGSIRQPMGCWWW